MKEGPFGNLCWICPVCGKVTVEVETLVSYVSMPPRPQLRQQCGCGWVGPEYPGEPDGYVWAGDWREHWEFVNRDPRMLLWAAGQGVMQELRKALTPALEAIARAMNKITGGKS